MTSIYDPAQAQQASQRWQQTLSNNPWIAQGMANRSMGMNPFAGMAQQPMGGGMNQAFGGLQQSGGPSAGGQQRQPQQQDPYGQYMQTMQGQVNPSYQGPQQQSFGPLPQRPWQKVNPMPMNFPQYQRPQYNGMGFGGMAQAMAFGGNPQGFMPQQQFSGLNRVGSVLGNMMQQRQMQQATPRMQPPSFNRSPQQAPPWMAANQMTRRGNDAGNIRDFDQFSKLAGAAYNDLYKTQRAGYGGPSGDSYDPMVMRAAQEMMGQGLGGAKRSGVIKSLWNQYSGGQ